MPEPGDREAAPAKVNLYLHVVGRRADGYHRLDSLAIFPAIGDLLTAAASARSGELSLELRGPFAAALTGAGDNLVLRAARMLAAASGVAPREKLVLEKNLPVASGIGGGSADAAAALRLLARLWRVPIPDGLAVTLGADVPVCLASRPTRMAGIGEILSQPPPLPAFGMVLINPGMSVATPSVFAARAGQTFSAPARMPADWRDAETFFGWLGTVANDLETPAIALCPPIAEVLAALRGEPECRLARMSGSGATCFGLFPDPVVAAAAAARLRRPQWWVWGGAGDRDAGVAETA